MRDARLKALADSLVRYSVSLQPGEQLLISCSENEIPLARELVKSCLAAGGCPHVKMTSAVLTREVLLGMTEPCARVAYEYERARTDRMDAVISITTSDNPMELSDIPPDMRNLWDSAMAKADEKRRQGRAKWCIAIYPTPFYANRAGMSLEAFEDYYFSVCLMDYPRFARAMEALKARMERADQVQITAPGTDLRFSVKGVPKRVSPGDRNMPDGEVYTAPVRESVEGEIAFNVPSIFRGMRFENVRLVFRNGRVTQAYCNRTEDLNRILDIDLGARYTGEFAFGLNPRLTRPLGLTLFDEKIRGSIHFALGNALDVTDNGNRSVIHWDLVSLHTPEAGGGEIRLDGELIRKDGIFVIPELRPLNDTDY